MLFLLFNIFNTNIIYSVDDEIMFVDNFTTDHRVIKKICCGLHADQETYRCVLDHIANEEGLEEIYLDGNDFDLTDICFLRDALENRNRLRINNLRIISLRNNRMSWLDAWKAFYYLLVVLRHNNHIDLLDLVGCSDQPFFEKITQGLSGGRGFVNEEKRTIIDIMGDQVYATRDCKNLDCSDTSLVRINIEKWSDLCRLPKESYRNICSINLRSSRHDADFNINKFSTFLHEMKNLENLNLAGNDITDAEIKDIAEALRDKTKLRKLDVSFNAFGDLGVLELSNILFHKYQITHVNIMGNDFTIGRSVCTLLFALSDKYSLQSLKMATSNNTYDSDENFVGYLSKIILIFRSHFLLKELVLTWGYVETHHQKFWSLKKIKRLNTECFNLMQYGHLPSIQDLYRHCDAMADYSTEW